jgi:hypothetical protein
VKARDGEEGQSDAQAVNAAQPLLADGMSGGRKRGREDAVAAAAARFELGQRIEALRGQMGGRESRRKNRRRKRVRSRKSHR